MLRIIFGLKWKEAVGDQRNLHNEKLHDVCSSSPFVRRIKLWRMRWAQHVAYTILVWKIFREAFTSKI
jgi:hypothetical protein